MSGGDNRGDRRPNGDRHPDAPLVSITRPSNHMPMPAPRGCASVPLSPHRPRRRLADFCGIGTDRTVGTDKRGSPLHAHACACARHTHSSVPLSPKGLIERTSTCQMGRGEVESLESGEPRNRRPPHSQVFLERRGFLAIGAWQEQSRGAELPFEGRGVRGASKSLSGASRRQRAAWAATRHLMADLLFPPEFRDEGRVFCIFL